MEHRPFSDISYKAYLDEEKLMGSKCSRCGNLYVPPRHFCNGCRSDKMEWHEMKGSGELAAFTCIFVAPPYMVERGHDRKNPYCTGVVKLEEGPRIVARIVDVDAKQPESIEVGTPVEVDYIHTGEGEETDTTLAFKPKG
jgi:uncharacterized protein